MARFIPDPVLEEVRLRSDIVEVIQTYLPLKRAGGRLKACCPFHQEKTPSFIVSPDRQSYHCFGCGKGGDVFRFVMEKENVDFPAAVELLAMRCGVEIPEERPRRGGGAAAGGESQEPAGVKRPRLFQLHEDLAAWYADRLREDAAGAVAKYVAGRGLDADTVAKFRLGASPDSWDETMNRCLRRGYTQEELLAAGIVLEPEEKKRTYDRFRGRLMFPIWDEQGRVIGFSARAIMAETEGAKYVNSPETPIFRKGRVLYALPLAREGFRQHGYAILCEGQLDTIALHRAGYDNAVAPQGTAFTVEQARILRRYTGKVLLAFDGDEAGTKATLRALEILLPQDFEVGIVTLPAGADPDGLFKAGGRAAIEPLVQGAGDFFEVVCERTAREVDRKSPWGRRKLADAALRLVALIGNGVTRAGYCSRLALRLEMPEETVFTEVKRLRMTQAKAFAGDGDGAGAALPSGQAPTPATELTPQQRAEAILLELSLVAGVYGKRLAEEMPPEWVDDSPLGRALGQVVAMTVGGEWEEAGKRLAAGLAQQPDPALSGVLASSQFEVDEGAAVDSRDEIREKAYRDAMNSLARGHSQQAIQRLTGELRQGGGDAAAILGQISELKRGQIGLPKPGTAPPASASPPAANQDARQAELNLAPEPANPGEPEPENVLPPEPAVEANPDAEKYEEEF